MPFRPARIRVLALGHPRLMVAFVAVVAVTVSMSQWTVPEAEAAPVPPASSIAVAEVPLVAADVRSAKVTARVRRQRVEAVSERSETATTWANPNGSMTTDESTGPVRVFKDNAWVPLDLDLVEVVGGWAPKASPSTVTFSAGGDGPAVKLSEGSKNVRMDWTKTLPAPVIKGSRATYALDATTDLVLTALPDGFEQLLVLKAPPVLAPKIHLPLDLSGLSVRDAAGGNGWQFVDSAGKVVFETLKPIMWDAQRDDAGDPTNRRVVSADLIDTAGGPQLDLAPVMSWLTDPTTKYPVTIDPTIASVTRAGDTWIREGDTTVHGADYHLGVGFTGVNKMRGLVKFTNDPLYMGAQITSASLNLYEHVAYTCTANPTYAYPISSDYALSTVTWANQPTVNTTATYSASASFAHGVEGAGGCPNDFAAINVTKMVTGWASGALANYGIELRASETVALQRKYFCSMNFDASATTACTSTPRAPTLSVTYNLPPNVPGTPTHTPGTSSNAPTPGWTTTTTPTLSATVTDPDGGTVKALFSVYLNGAATPLIDKLAGSSVTSGGVSSLVVPAAKLVNGSTYVVRVYANDGLLTSAMAVGYDRFTVDTAAPATAPSISSDTFPQDTWSVAVDTAKKAHFDLAAATTDSTKLQWYLDGTTTWGNTAVVTGTTPVIDAGIDLTDVAQGEHFLYARSLDLAGNASPTRSYHFYYGPGAALAQPLENQVTARRLPLQLSVDPALVTSLGSPSFEYRRGDADTWHPVPLGEVTTPAGAAVTAWPAQADSSAVYFWDAATTLGGVGGAIDVRAKFSTNAPATTPVTTTVDIDEGQAATGAAGPGSVNLSTGALSLSASDASWFGVGIGRSYGSRSLTAGTKDGQAGAFGPQWATGASGADSSYTMVAKTSPTSVDVLASGDLTSFTLKAGTSGSAASWDPQPGSEALHLVGDPDGAAGSVFTLTGNDRTVTTFKKPAGGPAETWPVYGTTSSGDDNAARYASAVDAAGKLRLSVIAAPNPALTPAELDSCATVPVPAGGPARGCRVLDISWGSVTTTTGAQPRVTGIDAWAWDPATSAMTKSTLAGFGYDANGWLTSATDTITNLVTSYGYDASGLLTSLTPAHAPSVPNARLPFTFGYAGAGVTAGPVWDRTTATSGGRLVTVTRATLTPGSLSTINGTASTNIVYGVPVTKTARGPADVSAANTASWGQFSPALEGTAIFDGDAAAQPGSNTDFWAGDDTITRSWTAAQVTYIDVNGREVNHLARDGGLDAASYDVDGNQVFALSAGNRAIATGEAPGADALGLAGQDSAFIGQQLATVSGVQPGTITTVGDEPSQRPTYTAGPLHMVVNAAGARALERAVTRDAYDQGRPTSIAGSTVPPAADMATSTTTGGVAYLADPATAALDDPRTTTSTYDWALGQSTTETVDPSPAAGDEITTSTAYDTAGRPISSTMPGGTAAGTALTTYYDTATTAPCTGHPEWGGMVCTSAKQGPITSGANPELVSTTSTYSRTGAPAVVLETANSINRTSTITYDSAERPVTVAIAATTSAGGATTALGAPVAIRTLTYDPDTGDLTTVSATIGGATQTIATTTDALGRQVSTTDGTGLAGNTQFDALDRATRFTQTDTANTLPGGGHRTFATTSAYDPNSGRLATSTDDQAGTTTLGYGIDGEITSQAVTTGAGMLTMTQTGDPTGAPTSRQWQLGTAPVSSEKVTGNIHSQWIDHTTTAGTVRRYSYDRVSRLTAVTNLNSDNTCTGHSHTYNTNSDRLGEAATTPVPAGATSPTNPTGCTTPAAPATSHTFDSADRLTDPGYTYDTFGRTTRLPLGGATSTALTGQVMRVDYNVNDLVATQKVYANATDADAASGAGQNPTATQTYTLDATGQRLQTFASTGTDPGTGLSVTNTKTNRYASGSDSPAWIDEGTTGPAAGILTRNITGPAGGLLATTSNPAAGGAGTLDWALTSLHGDIAVTLPDDITQALQAVPLADEFGVPDPTDTATRGADNRYGWLGSEQRSTEAPGGVTLMGVRLYNPTTGRFLSTDPVPGGNANAYTYPTDPVNDSDLSGNCSSHSIACIRKLLTSNEAWPVGFLTFLSGRGMWAKYRHTWAGWRKMETHGDHCSWPAVNTGLHFDFTNACDTHDLGYELLRFFGLSGPRIPGARQYVDSLFYNDMKADCRRRSILVRNGCYRRADKYYHAINSLSWLLHYDIPSM